MSKNLFEIFGHCPNTPRAIEVCCYIKKNNVVIETCAVAHIFYLIKQSNFKKDTIDLNLIVFMKS